MHSSLTPIHVLMFLNVNLIHVNLVTDSVMTLFSENDDLEGAYFIDLLLLVHFIS